MNSHLQLFGNNHHLLMRLPPSPIYSAISSGEKININNTNNKSQDLWSANQTASGLTSASNHHINFNTSKAKDTKNQSLPICELPEYDGCKYLLLQLSALHLQLLKIITLLLIIFSITKKKRIH